MWTILTLLKEAERFLKEKEISSPRLEVEILMSFALSLDRVGLYTNYSRPVEKSELDRFRDLIRRRIEGEPTAYLTGRKEFFSLDFSVTPDVLIPRPETEELVQVVLDHVPDDGAGLEVADLGTGSGCIAITLLVLKASLRAVGIDSSANALMVAKTNAELHGVSERIRFIHGDFCKAFLEEPAPGPFHVILSNPPYVDPNTTHPVDREVTFEPREAVFTPPKDPFHFYRRMLAEAAPYLVPEGLLVFELGMDQYPDIIALVEESGWQVMETGKDLAGVDRVMTVARCP